MERRDRLAFAIGEAMRRRGLTPPKLASMIGKNADTVRRWRDGETVPSAIDVGPLAEALGVRADYLTTPPPIPEYPIDEFLVRETVFEGLAEGIDRAR